MGARNSRNKRRVEPTDDREALVPLSKWPEQERYGMLRLPARRSTVPALVG